jgi:tryptophan-rich sensory protein
MRAFLGTSAAVGTTAVVGTVGTDVSSSWYRQLDKPPWQPPGPVFGIVWTGLYVLLALAGGRAVTAIDRHGAGRRGYVRAYAVNLALNAGWPWVFFRAESPLLAVVESGVLTASTADLVRRSWRVDPTAGAALLPYLTWVTGATVLSAEIARRNA